jgi:hypothetical protein
MSIANTIEEAYPCSQTKDIAIEGEAITSLAIE